MNTVPIASVEFTAIPSLDDKAMDKLLQDIGKSMEKSTLGAMLNNFKVDSAGGYMTDFNKITKEEKKNLVQEKKNIKKEDGILNKQSAVLDSFMKAIFLMRMATSSGEGLIGKAMGIVNSSMQVITDAYEKSKADQEIANQNNINRSDFAFLTDILALAGGTSQANGQEALTTMLGKLDSLATDGLTTSFGKKIKFGGRKLLDMQIDDAMETIVNTIMNSNIEDKQKEQALQEVFGGNYGANIGKGIDKEGIDKLASRLGMTKEQYDEQYELQKKSAEATAELVNLQRKQDLLEKKVGDKAGSQAVVSSIEKEIRDLKKSLATSDITLKMKAAMDAGAEEINKQILNAYDKVAEPSSKFMSAIANAFGGGKEQAPKKGQVVMSNGKYYADTNGDGIANVTAWGHNTFDKANEDLQKTLRDNTK